MLSRPIFCPVQQSCRKSCVVSCAHVSASHSRVPAIRLAGGRTIIATWRTGILSHHLQHNARPCTRTQVLVTNSASEPQGEVSVIVEKPAFNSRRLFASVDISAPMMLVWDALTDYDNLQTFIPSLVENKCISRKERSAVLYQVGAQDVAMGVKFAAKCTLECTEYTEGVPEWMVAAESDINDVLFPMPKVGDLALTAVQAAATLLGTSTTFLSGEAYLSVDEAYLPPRDITFRLLEGDFKAFKGIWRMQARPGANGAEGTRLSYSLYVQPQPWLPAGLIQGRIEKEVVRNLEAVRTHTEMQIQGLKALRKVAA